MKITEASVKSEVRRFDISSYGDKNFANSLSLLYQENSKLNKYSSRIYGAQIAGFDQDYFNKRASQPFKVYGGKKTYDLEPYLSEEMAIRSDLVEVIKSRRSIRSFDDYQISLLEIANILFHGYGVTTWENTDGNIKWGFRTVPSGGALYPLEIYMLNLNSSIDRGLYHYRPDVNKIEYLKPFDKLDDIEPLLSAKPYVELENATSIIFVTSVTERYLVKYGDRGYRWALLEVGFVIQNMNLIVEALGLGSCSLGGFLDDPLNEFLGIDGVGETIQSVMVVGKPEQPEKDGDD